jgi:hypothetical protein
MKSEYLRPVSANLKNRAVTHLNGSEEHQMHRLPASLPMLRGCINEQFGESLRRAVRQQYNGKIPSAAKVARDFNLLAGQTDQISQETMRKWLRGVAIPRASRLLTLSRWLGTQIQDAILNFNSSEERFKSEANQSPGNGSQRACMPTVSLIMSTDELIRHVLALDPQRQLFLFLLIKELLAEKPLAGSNQCV